MQTTFDLIVIGGGINGCGIARDAAGRGLKVLLVERDDLASATSSWSTKLIHGGLRYLEQYEFRLVRESLQEREVLLRLAPHITRPMEFVLPHDSSMRPAWMVRCGLWLYDHIGGPISLRRSRGIDFPHPLYGAPLKPSFRRAFAYSDVQVDDARLTLLNALAAQEEGAVVRTRTEVVSGTRVSVEGMPQWQLTLRDVDSGNTETICGRGVVNAGGPWVKDVLTGALNCASAASVRLVKGSHIVVPRVHEGDHAYLLQNDDKRVCFVIPYQQRYSLIGTTDVVVDSLADGHRIDDQEIDYLLRAANRYLRQPLTKADIVWTYAGVRPLYDDGEANASQITRDYVLKTDHQASQAPVLSIFGGKITTYRKLAEHALSDLAPYFPQMGAPWTDSKPLPGGDIDSVTATAQALHATHSGLPPDYLEALVRRYGSRAKNVLNGARSIAGLGEIFGAGAALLSEREIEYCIRAEFARTADDILWRRTKCGLHMDANELARAQAFIVQKMDL